MAKLYYTRLSDYALTASGGTDTGFSLDNLTVYDFRKQWQSAVNTNGQTLASDMGLDAGLPGLIARDSLVLDNHSSFSPMAIDLEAADNAAFTSGKVTAISDLMTSGTPSGASTRQFWTFTAQTKRYWRLLFNDTSGVKPKVGKIFIYRHLDVQDNIEAGWALGTASQFRTETEDMLDGFLKSSQQGQGRKRFELRFTLVSDFVVTRWMTFQQTTRGAFHPFYFNYDTTQLWLLKNEADYSPAHGKAYNLNDIVQLNLIEPMATRS